MRFTHDDVTVDVLPWVMHGMDLGRSNVQVFKLGNLIHSIAIDHDNLHTFLARINKSGIEDLVEDEQSYDLKALG